MQFRLSVVAAVASCTYAIHEHVNILDWVLIGCVLEYFQLCVRVYVHALPDSHAFH